MAVLISLFKESVSPPKKACLDSGSQSASHPMMVFSSNENQFLEQSNGNQFAMTSCGDQFSTTQIPSGSFDLRLAMPMAPNPTSPMALSHISTESTEGSFVPTYHNVERGILNTSNQGCQADSSIHFVEDESLGLKLSEVFATYVEDCHRKRILNTELLKLKDRFDFSVLQIVLRSMCLQLTQTYGLSYPVSKRSKINASKMPSRCFQRA